MRLSPAWRIHCLRPAGCRARRHGLPGRCGSAVRLPGNCAIRSASTRSMIACACSIVIAGGRSTWNWTKSRFPLVRVRRSWRLDSSGWRAAASTKAWRFSSGHSRSIRSSTASLAPRHAPHASQPAMARPNSGSAIPKPAYWSSTSAAITGKVQQQVGLVMQVIGLDREASRPVHHESLPGKQRESERDGDQRYRDAFLRRSGGPARRQLHDRAHRNAECRKRDQHDLEDRRQRLRLAMTETVILVGGHGGEPDAGQRGKAGHEIERRIGQAAEHGSGPGPPASPGLERDQYQRDRDRRDRQRTARVWRRSAVMDTAACRTTPLPQHRGRTAGDHAAGTGDPARTRSAAG